VHISLHTEDFHLAQRCLAHEKAAISLLQETHRSKVLSFLVSSGAAKFEAEELTDSLWADCLIGTPEKPPRLSRYDGSCALLTWLNTVAVNRLLTQKRKSERWGRLIPGRIDAESSGSAEEGSGQQMQPRWEEPDGSDIDPPLLELMRQAIEQALASCPSESFIMLQLVHGTGLRMHEVAQMFGCAEATVSRTLKQAGEQITRDTLANVRAQDQWLEVKWSDFLELCRSAPFLRGWD
jgi:RNA polymerase sigma factor (sigma-70 family)